MLGVEQMIRIEEIPTWIFIPFAILVVTALTWAVRWILRTPSSETRD